jgi:hypothetical protein
MARAARSKRLASKTTTRSAASAKRSDRCRGGGFFAPKSAGALRNFLPGTAHRGSLDATMGENDDDDNAATIVASGHRDDVMNSGTIVMGNEPKAPTPVDPRLARMQAIAQAGLAPRRPAAGVGGAPKPPGPRQPVYQGAAATAGADPERRVLPFPTPVPPPPDFDPMNRTVALMDDEPAPPKTSRFPSVPPAAPLPPEAAPAPSAFAPEPRVVVHPPPSSTSAPTVVTNAHERRGTPAIVLRFLVVCGVLTVVGLAALLYLVR